MTEFKWSIRELKSIDVEGFADFVVEIYWQIEATDKEGNLVTDYSPEVRFDVPESVDGLAPFSDLTEEQAIAWVKAAPPPDGPDIGSAKTLQEYVEAKCEMRLAEARRPQPRETKGEALPWKK